MKKKLTLNKMTVSDLEQDEMKNLKGGSVLVGSCVSVVPYGCCTDLDKLCPCPE